MCKTKPRGGRRKLLEITGLRKQTFGKVSNILTPRKNLAK
jgi:hypothetical protein